MSKLIAFEKLNNTRDLGGMKTESGRVIRSGKLIRSGFPGNASEADKDALKKLVGVIVDFRSDEEKNDFGTSSIEGVKYHSIPIIDDLTAGITRDKKSDMDLFKMFMANKSKARDYMCEMYKSFASETAVTGYSKFVRILLEGSDKAILWNCTAGKDRAGIGAAIVEWLLGVSYDDSLADYLVTNNYIKASVNAMLAQMEKMGGSAPKIDINDEMIQYFFMAMPEFFETFHNEMLGKFGSFKNFVANGLQLTDKDVEKLREMYSE